MAIWQFCPSKTQLKLEKSLNFNRWLKTKAVYDSESFKTAIREKGLYKAGGNFWWTLMVGTMHPGVPIRVSAINDLKTHYFTNPAPYPTAVMVAVRKDEDPMQHKGAMRRVSPPELQWALILAVAEELSAGGFDEASKERLEQWKSVMLSVSFHFKLLESTEDMPGTLAGNNPVKRR